jgi:hypothetical protein
MAAGLLGEAATFEVFARALQLLRITCSGQATPIRPRVMWVFDLCVERNGTPKVGGNIMVYLKDDFLKMQDAKQVHVAETDSTASFVNQVRDLAISQFPEAFALTLELAGKELFDQATKQTSHLMYCLYMDTHDQIKANHLNLAATFKRQLFQRYNAASRRGAAIVDLQERLQATEFNLVEPDELELTLASNTLSHAIEVKCHDEAIVLDRCMGQIIGQVRGDTELRAGSNPLGPDVMAEAVMDAIKTLTASNKIKLMLVTRLNQHWPAHVKRIYLEINQFLASEGIVPKAPSPQKNVSVHQFGGTQTTSNSGTGDKQSATTKPASTSNQDTFAMLQTLMEMGRIGAGPTLPDLPNPGQVTSTPARAANECLIDNSANSVADGAEPVHGAMPDSAEVMQRLTRIQHGESAMIGSGSLDPALIANGKVNVLRAIKNTGAAGGMGHMDTMTLDIVALIFDYILDDHRLPDPMKALIGRLQIPVLKVAMLDKSFFTHKSHPARKLLDTLADAAIGWDASDGHDSRLYREVDGVVQRILNEFEDKVEIFAEVLEDFQRLMEEEKRLANERACLSAQFLQHQEQFDMARNLASEAVQARLLDTPLPAHIATFLYGPWVANMAHVYLHSGATSSQWNQGLQTIDDLIWSLQPKSSKDDRQKLVALLPKLLKRLDDGIQNAGISRDERDHFFTHLVQFHSDAVKAGLQGTKTSFSTEAAAMPARHAAESLAHSPAYSYDSPTLQDLPETVGESEPDQRILREISAPSELTYDSEEIVVGDVTGQDRISGDTGINADSHDTLVSHLKRGAWLEFTLDDGSHLRAKLAWVSPLRGTFLFTNRLGERAVSINESGLAQKLREGSARVVDNVALIDRAVSSLFERLHKSA